jgi:hypothetical protein
VARDLPDRVDLRTDRVGVLLHQLESTCEHSCARLEALTDEDGGPTAS